MSVSLPNPRPIKGLSPQAKANLVVSNTLIPDGTMFVVSRYGDEVWKWRFYIEQENLCLANKQIAWDIALPDGRLLTDPKHAVLLESTKDFIWTLFADPVEGRKRPMFFTLTHKFKDTIPLQRWMVWELR